MPGLVIIPAYNESPTIGPVLENLKETLPDDADILVIDDGSKDNTVELVRQSGVKLCKLPCNLGYAKALKTGLKWGLSKSYDWFAFMDSDGQHRPIDMVQLIEHMNSKKVDLVIGSRWMKTGIPDPSTAPGRRMGMIFFSWLTRKLTGQRLTDTTSGMKIMNRHVAQELLSHNFGDFHSEIIIYLHDRGYHIEESPIVVHERQAGTSMYSVEDALIYPAKNLILIFVFKLNSWALKKVGRT